MVVVVVVVAEVVVVNFNGAVVREDALVMTFGCRGNACQDVKPWWGYDKGCFDS